VSASANENPDRNENASEADRDKSKAGPLQPYSPQANHKCVDRKNLVRCASISLRPEFTGRRDNKNDQGNPEFTNLLDDALCRTIGSGRNDPVVSPPDIEYTTPGLQNIKHEKRKL